MLSLTADDHSQVTHAVTVTKPGVTFYIGTLRNYHLSLVAYNPTVTHDNRPSDTVNYYLNTTDDDGRVLFLVGLAFSNQCIAALRMCFCKFPSPKLTAEKNTYRTLFWELLKQ